MSHLKLWRMSDQGHWTLAGEFSQQKHLLKLQKMLEAQGSETRVEYCGPVFFEPQGHYKTKSDGRSG